MIDGEPPTVPNSGSVIDPHGAISVAHGETN